MKKELLFAMFALCCLVIFDLSGKSFVLSISLSSCRGYVMGER